MIETHSLATWELATLLVGCGLTVAILVAGFLLRVTSFAEEDTPETEKLFSSSKSRNDLLSSFQKKGKKSQKKFVFPPQEDKFARRNRWARVLAKGVRTVGGFSSNRKAAAVVKPREVSPEQIIDYFVAADRKQQLASNGYNQGGHGGLIREGNGYRNGGLVRDVGPMGERRMERDGVIGGMTFMEAKRIKGRILRLLFEAGPAKILCPIREALCEGEEKEREKRGRGLLFSSVGEAAMVMAASALTWSRGGVEEEKEREREMEGERDIELGLLSEGSSDEVKRPNGSNGSKEFFVGVGGERWIDGKGEREEGEREKYQAVDLDLDPVVAIGSMGVSREMLWLVLARLGKNSKGERVRVREMVGGRERTERVSQEYEFGSVDNV